MKYTSLVINRIIFFLLFGLCTSTISAGITIYNESFNNLDLSKWTPITSDGWQIISGAVSSTGGRPGLIFGEYDDSQYISESDLTANYTRIQNYAQVGFYLYYKDSDNYGRVFFSDDNRGTDYHDNIGVESKGISFKNTQAYINTSTNTSIQLDPNVFHHLKVVRLNKNIYVYFDHSLALTTEFKDDNPEGKVGFDVYESTGYFDNFYLRPISMKNPSGYIDKLNINSTNPTTRLGAYTLRLEGIEKDGNAMFSLSKFGKKVDTTLAVEGTTATLNFENGDSGVEFKLVKAFSGGSGGIVQLEDIITASSDSIR
jgi:hypothetical protein